MKIADACKRIIEFLVLEFCEIQLNEVKHRPADNMVLVFEKWL